ncbi:hypothetical protein C7I84_10255 [Mesorhizobium ephedrae]|uniref:Uncharacterized protein n=2 Tax=Kumtagia ephedrae TaxID=2116701 RepID=A0A2P7SFC2_9HYPH|nr:hypothetical protein C7I84_10255 [Mesorhizobium ephedrae]
MDRRPGLQWHTGRLKEQIMLSPAVGRHGMTANGMANSAELRILTKAVDDYCREHRVADGPARDHIAYLVMQLFRQGAIDPLQLEEGLDAIIEANATVSARPRTQRPS